MARTPRPRLNAKPAAPKKGRKPPPANETARGKFERLGRARMKRVLASIRLLGNLASPIYECSPDDVAKMKAAIDVATDAAMLRFMPRVGHRAKADDFDFSTAPSSSIQH